MTATNGSTPSLAELDTNRALLARLLAEHLPEIVWTPPQATYLAWLDCRPLGLGDDPTRAFLDRGRVALTRPGLRHCRAGAGHARLNFGTSPEIINEILQRMTKAVGEDREQH